MADTHFARNLAILRARHPKLAARLESMHPAGVQVHACRNGMRTLSSSGVLLASERNPVFDAERTAESIATEQPDIVFGIGFGLGLEWKRLQEQRHCAIAVFEPDLNRLRAALDLDHTFEWMGFENVLITDNPRDLAGYIDSRYVSGLRLKISLLPSAQRLNPEAVREAVRIIGATKDTVDVTAATRMHLAEAWTEQCVENAPQYLSAPGISKLVGPFVGRPAVIAAAGPSLEKQLPALKRMQDRVLTFAVGPSLGALRQAGVRPDFVHLLEANDVSHQLLRSGPTDDLNLILTPKAHSSLYALPTRSRFVAYTASDGVALWANQHCGGDLILNASPSVAMQAVWIAAALGANPIVLIGQDLAFTGGRVYAQGSCYEDIEAKTDSEGNFTYTNMESRIDAYGGDKDKLAAVTTQRTVWVPGWDGRPVASCVSYATFLHGYEDMGEHLSENGIQLINCTEGGARIGGIPHQAFQDTLAGFSSSDNKTQHHIDTAHAAWSRPDFSTLRQPMQKQQRQLRRIERNARRARQCTQAIRRSSRFGTDLQSDLRRIERLRARIAQGLGEIPWLESLVHAEIQKTITLQHRVDRSDPTPDEALEETLELFSAVEAGAIRASRLASRLEDVLRIDNAPTHPVPSLEVHLAAP